MLWGLRPVKLQAAYGIAVDRLRRQIHTGLLLPDERLPPERKLAEDIGISRATLREALRTLEGSNYIKIVRGAQGGAFVEALPVLQQLAVSRIARDPGDMMRILEFREANELAATRLAVSRRSVPELKRMRLAVVQMREANGPAVLKQAQSIFRLAISEASRNIYLAKSVEDGLSEAFLPYPNEKFFALQEEAVALHMTFFDAISDRQEENALAALRDIMAYDWNLVRRLLKKVA